MKKLLPIAATALLTGFIIVSSCKKKDDNPVGNWTCSCTVVASGVTTTPSFTYSSTAKNTATASCASVQSGYIAVGATSATCTLK